MKLRKLINLQKKRTFGTWSSSKFKSLGGSTSTTNGGGNEKCDVCGKTVYLTEKISADSKSYHKACFRCCHCNGQLKLGSYASLNGKYYCKPHFKQLFASKGNYNEGFGEEKLTAKWDQQQSNAKDELK